MKKGSHYHSNQNVVFLMFPVYAALTTKSAVWSILGVCSRRYSLGRIAHGMPRTDEECDMWNRFMTKAGWRDDRSARLQQLVVEYGLAGKPVETVFDLFDYDEDRDPAAERPWLSV
jgi:Domain of unknown function (DUF5069)